MRRSQRRTSCLGVQCAALVEQRVEGEGGERRGGGGEGRWAFEQQRAAIQIAWPCGLEQSKRSQAL